MDAKAVETLTVESESAESAKRRFAAGDCIGIAE